LLDPFAPSVIGSLLLRIFPDRAGSDRIVGDSAVKKRLVTASSAVVSFETRQLLAFE
jgi:hypothetical protein